MLDNFDPREKKAILLFIALLILGLIYISTHRINWNTTEMPGLQDTGTRMLPDEESAAESGRYL